MILAAMMVLAMPPIEVEVYTLPNPSAERQLAACIDSGFPEDECRDAIKVYREYRRWWRR